MKIFVLADLSRASTRYVNVRMDFLGLTAKNLVLTFPTWSPGNYLVREHQGLVEDFTATTAPGGRKLPYQKISKCQWQIATSGAAHISASYRVYTHELNVRSAYLDHETAFYNPTAVFFHPEGGLHLPVALRVRVPAGWRLAAARTPAGGTFRFNGFDDFYDMPVLAGPALEVRSFRAGKTRYRMAFWGSHFGDTAKIAADVKKIVERQARVFGDNPCRDYLFQVMFAKGKYGGLEHGESSTNLFDGTLLPDKKSYGNLLGLLSHEHFHLWNVKRIRPRALGPFDYTRENYTRELWLAEGVTNYYDDHTVFRAGLFSRDEYLQVLSDNLVKMENQKARLTNSLSDASFDAWVRFYRPTENSMNTVTSYYLKGGLVMMLLDFRIIRASAGKRSLDDVMRDLYRLYKTRPALGLTREEIFASVAKFARIDARRFIMDYIDGVKPIAWEREFRPFGLTLIAPKDSRGNFLGVTLGKRDGRVIIQGIAEDSPAYKSKLRSQDELIALNGERIENENQIDNHLKKARVSVLVARFGQVLSAEIVLAQNRGFNKKLAVAKRLTPVQRRNLAKFLRT